MNPALSMLKYFKTKSMYEKGNILIIRSLSKKLNRESKTLTQQKTILRSQSSTNFYQKRCSSKNYYLLKPIMFPMPLHPF